MKNADKKLIIKYRTNKNKLGSVTLTKKETKHLWGYYKQKVIEFNQPPVSLKQVLKKLGVDVDKIESAEIVGENWMI